MKDHSHTLELIKALAHPARVQILWMLSSGEQHVCHLAISLGRRQAYVSQQLADLRRAGLIIPTRKGQHIIYRLCNDKLAELLPKLCALIAPDCYVCLVLPTPWWLCPCPKCKDIRIQAGLGLGPLGTRGYVGRAEMTDCACCVCIRVLQVSAEHVAISLNSNCTHVQQWGAQLHLLHISSLKQSAQMGSEPYMAASRYLCHITCPAPTLVQRVASVAAHRMAPANNWIEYISPSLS